VSGDVLTRRRAEARRRSSAGRLTKTPAEITLYGEGFLLQGIYRFDGDDLTIAMCADCEVERPKGFSTEESSGSASPIIVTRFQRPTAAADRRDDWDSRAISALLSRESGSLETLAAEFRKLSPEARRGLPLVIRNDSVEFAFRGSLKLESNITFAEFLFAGEDRAYESLVVGSQPELARLAALRPIFEQYGREQRHQWWQGQLQWVEGTEAHTANLADVFGNLNATDRAYFFDGQEIDSQGYFGGEATTGKNVECDTAFLPKKSGPVVLRLVVRYRPTAEPTK
jgi:hypothetical protein